MRLSAVTILMSFFFPIQAFGQICGMSHYPHGFAGTNRPQMQGHQFLKIEENLPFLVGEPRARYAQFWINTDVLNIRSGPGLEHDAVLETYFGNLVFAYAKQGDWIAIDAGVDFNGAQRLPYWVNANYLTGQRVKSQVNIDVLKQRCSFEDFGAVKFEWPPNLTTPHQCKSVYNYLMQQSWLLRKHQYGKDYKVWRDVQEDPTKLGQLACY